LLHEVEQKSVDGDIELYHRTNLSGISTEGNYWDLTFPCLGDKEIKVTIKKCSGLFIVASVIIKFVSSPDDELEE
jgi:hypothetical protein